MAKLHCYPASGVLLAWCAGLLLDPRPALALAELPLRGHQISLAHGAHHHIGDVFRMAFQGFAQTITAKR